MGRAKRMQTAATTVPRTALSRMSWPALAFAFSCSFAPRYWLTTTAPPVASAANSTMMRLFIISTRLTPEMAASPQRETIMVSAMPTVTARNCSMSSGPTSRSRSFWENSGVRPLNQPAFSPADAFFTIYILLCRLQYHICFLFQRRLLILRYHLSTAFSAVQEPESSLRKFIVFLFETPRRFVLRQFAGESPPGFVRCAKSTAFRPFFRSFFKKGLVIFL
jgi:hypothetical protein